MVSGADAASNGNIIGSSLSDAIRAGLSCRLPRYQLKKACIFGCDPVSLAGEIVSDLADCCSPSPVPFISDLRVPGWVGRDTLAIAIGETCAKAMAEELERRGCIMIAFVQSDIDIYGAATVRIPDGLGFAGSIGFVLGAVSGLISSLGIFDAAKILADDLDLIDSYESSCVGIIPLDPARLHAFYSTSDIHAAARICRAALTVCAGKVAFCGELPEFDHNELVGWSDPNGHAPDLEMIVVRGRNGEGIVTDIVDSMLEVLSENGRDVKVYGVPGEDAAAKDCCALLLGTALAGRAGE